MTFDQYQAAIARTGDIYVACPACSGDRAVTPNRALAAGDQVWNCSACGAVFGRVASWRPYTPCGRDNTLSAGEAAQYFDFTLRFDLRERFHGWLDADGIVCQVG